MHLFKSNNSCCCSSRHFDGHLCCVIMYMSMTTEVERIKFVVVFWLVSCLKTGFIRSTVYHNHFIVELTNVFSCVSVKVFWRL